MALSLFLCCERSFWQLATMPGGNVGDADGGVGGVDVLAAFAAGSVGIDAQIFGLDDDLDAFVNFGRHVDAGERGVAALGLVEGGDADQAVDADFAGEQAEGVLAVDGEGGGFDAGFFGGLVVVDFGRKPWRSAQRRYMRRSMSAQSCDSTPPAPGWMVMMALRWSLSPESRVSVSRRSTSDWSAPISRWSRARLFRLLWRVRSRRRCRPGGDEDRRQWRSCHRDAFSHA